MVTLVTANTTHLLLGRCCRGYSKTSGCLMAFRNSSKSSALVTNMGWSRTRALFWLAWKYLSCPRDIWNVILGSDHTTSRGVQSLFDLPVSLCRSTNEYDKLILNRVVWGSKTSWRSWCSQDVVSILVILLQKKKPLSLFVFLYKCIWY